MAPPRAALPDLAILVGRHLMELRASLMRDRVPHLAVSADEAIGVVGPLVIPGRTACLRCLDLTRAERDPAWPLILAQLDGREPNPCACDAPLAAAVAAQAAAQVLAFIDRACPSLSAPPLSSPRTLKICSAVRCWISCATISAGRPPSRFPRPSAVRPARPTGRVASFAVRVTARRGTSLTDIAARGC